MRKDEGVRAREERLKALLVRGLAGDAVPYHAFLRDLSAHLRTFLRRCLAQRPDEVEGLLQETLLAIHNQRHTFDPAQPLTATDAAPGEARCDLAKLLDNLPVRQRLPIVYMKLEGMSVGETARRTGMSEAAVKVAVHRGLKALAARMGFCA